MHEAIASPLEAWASFYVIVGASAASLTGLQFVVMTLIVQSGFSRTRGESIAAFGTPNVARANSAWLDEAAEQGAAYRPTAHAGERRAPRGLWDCRGRGTNG